MERCDGRVVAQRSAERVLSRTTTDDENVHSCRPRQLAVSGRNNKLWSRPGPTPTTLNGAPDISSSART